MHILTLLCKVTYMSKHSILLKRSDKMLNQVIIVGRLVYDPELVKLEDPTKVYNVSSNVSAYWGTSLTTHRLGFDYARRAYLLKEDYDNNYENSAADSVIKAADGEITKSVPNLNVYFTAPEAGKYEKLYIVVEVYGPRAGYFQYTYEWRP